MSGPRVPPLLADQLEAEHADLLEGIYRDATGATNVATMLLRHSLLFRLWAPLSGGLLYGSLSPHRDRELLILRTTPNCHAHYEWAHHVVIGKQAGLTDVDNVPSRVGLTPSAHW
jgi:4-carboxymuconolactone decarboxylase